MKKKITTIFAGVMCLIMLTACGGKETSGRGFGEKRDLTAVGEQDFSAYQSSKKQIKLSNSNAYKLFNKLNKGDTAYIGMEYMSGEQEMYLANDQGKNCVLKINVGDENISFYYDGTACTYYMSGDTEAYSTNEYPAEDVADTFGYSLILDQFFYDFANKAGTGMVCVSNVTIDGEKYTYEYYEDGYVGYCFDKNGNLCRVDNAMGGVLVHDITLSVPKDAFVQPEGYTIVNIDELS